MKKNDGVPVWIIFTIVALSLGMSIFSLIIANSKANSFTQLEFDYAKLVEFTGLFFTIIGVVFALYFVIIGIDATQKKDELEKIEADVRTKQSKIEEDIRKLELENLDFMYSHLIAIAGTISNSRIRKNTINSLRLTRARLASQSNYCLSLETRKKRIPDLAVLGVQSDIEDLEKIITDTNEEETLRELAKGIKQQIKERLNI